MVETITPVVHGGRARWLGTLALHALGASVTAALFGAVLGGLGRALGAPWGRAGLVAIGVGAGLYALNELTAFRMPVPQFRRQVPDWWRTFFGRPIAATLYGAGLGVGFLTYLANGTLVVVAFAAVATGRPWLGAALMAPFGLVRGLSAAVAWGSDSPERSRALVDRLVAMPAGRRQVANGAALGAVAAFALAAAFGAPVGGWASLAATALAAVWSWSSLAKLFGWPRWRRTVAAHRLPRTVTALTVVVVPIMEITIPSLVLLGRPTAAAAVSLALLGAFSAELLRARLVVGTGVPCGCFGGRDAIDVRSALARNGGLAIVSTLVLVAGHGLPRATWPGLPGATDALPFLLATVALLAAAITAWRTSVWLSRGGNA